MDRTEKKILRNNPFDADQTLISPTKSAKKSALTAAGKSTEGMSDIWIFDSGASSHMINNIKWFSDFKSKTSLILQAGIDSSLQFEGIGVVKA